MTKQCSDKLQKTPLRYLDEMWGGAHGTALDKSGPEMRFEIDFQTRLAVIDSAMFSWSSWEPILKLLGVERAAPKPSPYGLSIVAPEISVIINTEKLVMTAGSIIDLHLVFKAVADLCESAGAPIHWASFMHKETTSPTTNSQNMLEFASLHEVFPNGHPFFLGPITGDHFFCFIHDTIDRKDPNVHEDDVQVNGVFYVKGLPETQNELRDLALGILGGSSPDELNISYGKGSEFCATRFLNAEFFQTIRVTEGAMGTVASFETNVSSESEFMKMLNHICSTLKPQRFSVVLLLDPESTPKVDPQGPLAFDNFKVWNATTTELKGYLVKEINFVPAR